MLLQQGGFGTEKLFWFQFFKWVGTANAIGWLVGLFALHAFSRRAKFIFISFQFAHFQVHFVPFHK